MNQNEKPTKLLKENTVYFYLMQGQYGPTQGQYYGEGTGYQGVYGVQQTGGYPLYGNQYGILYQGIYGNQYPVNYGVQYGLYGIQYPGLYGQNEQTFGLSYPYQFSRYGGGVGSFYPSVSTGQPATRMNQFGQFGGFGGGPYGYRYGSGLNVAPWRGFQK